MTPADLVTAWRTQASTYDRDGVTVGARLLARVADELEAAIQDAGDDVLTLEEAAHQSGYSADHLRHLVADGTIPNAGGPRRPRIARRDLPKRAARQPATATYSPDADALRLVSGQRLG